MKSWITALVIIAVVGAAVVGAILFARSTTEPVPTNTNTSTQITVSVYFGNNQMNPNAQDCAAVFPVQRRVDAQNQILNTLQTLFAGPTTAEQATGFTSQFSGATANAVQTVRVSEGIAYVDLVDIRSIIPNASASCASANVLAAIETTVRQFPGVTSVVVAIDGQPRTFYEWLQLDCPAISNNCDAGPF